MAGGFFNFFSGKDNTPPAPEKRVGPAFSENIKNPTEGWITTGVFINHKDKKSRVYYAARIEDQMWKIHEYSYSISQPDTYKTETKASEKNLEGAIRLIASFNRILTTIEEGYSPVPGLSGNYREAAYLNAAYIDDKGNYIPVSEDTLITGNAALESSGIKAMYNKAASRWDISAVRSWGDFYSLIVARHDISASVEFINAPDSTWFVARCREMLKDAKEFERKMTDSTLSLREKQKALKSIVCAGVKTKDHPNPEYHYYAAQLTALMRAGSKVYSQCLTPASSSPETFQLLSDIGEAIRSFAGENRRLSLGKKMSKEIADLIVQGPDPYADKPLPLEVILSKYTAAPQKPEPKQPGL
jgi:hypothetical protein